MPLIKDKQMVERIKDVRYLVEASNFEGYTLWEKNQDRLEMSTKGFMKQVGSIGKKPITINYSVNKYRGEPIIFWHPTSMAVDYSVIEKFWKGYCPQLYKNNHNCYAENFHSCKHTIDRIVDPNSVNFAKEP